MSRKGGVRKPWTEDEIRQLLELKKSNTSVQVGELLGRSGRSISWKLSYIKKGKIQVRWDRHWSKDDRETLLRMWPDHTKQEVAIALGRHVGLVAAYARYMGLRESQQQRLAKGWQRMERTGVAYCSWTRDQADELLRLLETCTLEEVASATGRSIAAIRCKRAALKNGACSHSSRRGWSAQEKETLRLMWPDHRLAEVAAALGRSEKSVEMGAARLGLKKSVAYLLLHVGSAYHAYPTELRESIQMAKQIERKLNDRQDHRHPA